MLSLMSMIESLMPTESSKQGYLQSRTADNALAQLKPRLRSNATRLFATASEMFEVLTAAFGNANQKQEDRAAYQTLIQGTRDFSSFWAEFQRLTQDLDLSEEIKISDLIQKSHHSIQHKLATGEEEPTNLLQLAKRCQRIEQSLKEVNRSKYVQDRNAEREAAQKNNGSKSNRTIVNSPTTSAAPMQANFNLTNRMARISQPRAQINAPAAAASTPTVTIPAAYNGSRPRLSEDEMEKLKKFDRCFNCKEVGHSARGCMRPNRPYSSVNAALQEVMLLENTSESGKK